MNYIMKCAVVILTFVPVVHVATARQAVLAIELE